MDDYGLFVNNYKVYTEEGGMEDALGRKYALKALGYTKGATVLNFGCGPGTNSRELQAMGAKVIGVDISEPELETAREYDPDSTYVHYDGKHLVDALGGTRVDFILASFVFCTMEDGALSSVLHEMRRSLNTEGRLVIADPNLEGALGFRYGKELYYHVRRNVRSGDHVHVTLGSGDGAVELYHDIYRTHSDYLRLLGEAGFAITKMKKPRACGLNVLRWWPAILVPPFVIISAQ